MNVTAYFVELSSYGSGMCQVPNKESQSLPEQIFPKWRIADCQVSDLQAQRS